MPTTLRKTSITTINPATNREKKSLSTTGGDIKIRFTCVSNAAKLYTSYKVDTVAGQPQRYTLKGGNDKGVVEEAEPFVVGTGAGNRKNEYTGSKLTVKRIKKPGGGSVSVRVLVKSRDSGGHFSGNDEGSALITLLD